MKLFKRRPKPVRMSRRRNVLETLETRKLFAADLGSAPPDMLATPYAFVGDHSPSNSEKWSMQVGQTTLQASGFGEVERQRLSLEKGKSYPITVSHIDTNIEEDGEKKPDYDYRAWIDDSANPAWSSGPSTPSSDEWFVENSSGLLQRKFWGDDTNEATGSAMLHIPIVDFDIDSDRNGAMTSGDDWTELDSTTGALIEILAGDRDGDGTLDVFDTDGIAGAWFEPVEVELSANLQHVASPNGIRVTFDYDMANPGRLDGEFRLWQSDASADRSSDSQLIRAGRTYSAAELGLSPGLSRTFYLEAVSPSRRTVHFDKLKVTVNTVGGWDGTLTDTIHAKAVDRHEEELTFKVFENTTNEVKIGSVYRDGLTSFYITPGVPFDVKPNGDVVVREGADLNYEIVDSYDFDIIGFGSTVVNHIFHTTVEILDRNDPAIVFGSTDLVGKPLFGTSLTFFDEDNDDIIHLSGEPSNGELAINRHAPSGPEYGIWVPNVGATGDQFLLAGYDGYDDGVPESVSITMQGQTVSVGQFNLGTTAPPLNVDKDPGAIGDVSRISEPHAGWNTEIAGLLDLGFKAYIPESDRYLNDSHAAKDAMDRFLANTGDPYEYDLHKVLRQSLSARNEFLKNLNALIQTVDHMAFIGTIQLVDRQAHLGSTAGSVWQNAIGQYTGWGSATVTGTVVDQEVLFDVTYTYNLWDPYDWDPTKPFMEGQPPLANLHLAGLAKQYMTYGSHTTNVSWTRGDAPDAMLS